MAFQFNLFFPGVDSISHNPHQQLHPGPVLLIVGLFISVGIPRKPMPLFGSYAGNRVGHG